MAGSCLFSQYTTPPSPSSSSSLLFAFYWLFYSSRQRRRVVYALDMLHVEVSTPSPEPVRQPTLADLSRNASVISSSSSSSSVNELIRTPRPRPIRTFSSPRSRSRDAPPTPRSTRPPAYLAKELGLAVGDGSNSFDDLKKRAQSRSKSRTKSRNSSVGLKLQASDFDFGDILGEGSYSTVWKLHICPKSQFFSHTFHRLCMQHTPQPVKNMQ